MSVTSVSDYIQAFKTKCSNHKSYCIEAWVNIDMFVPSTNCIGVCLVCLSVRLAKVPNVWLLNERENVLVSSVKGSRD